MERKSEEFIESLFSHLSIETMDETNPSPTPSTLTTNLSPTSNVKVKLKQSLRNGNDDETAKCVETFVRFDLDVFSSVRQVPRAMPERENVGENLHRMIVTVKQCSFSLLE